MACCKDEASNKCGGCAAVSRSTADGTGLRGDWDAIVETSVAEDCGPVYAELEATVGSVAKGHQPAGATGVQSSGRVWLMTTRPMGAEDTAVDVSVAEERGLTFAKRAAVNRRVPKGLHTNRCRGWSRQGERDGWPRVRRAPRAKPST